jgi:hypothetical protein
MGDLRHQESFSVFQKWIDARDEGFMYIHMFAFRMKPEVTEELQERMLREIRDLPNHIPGILEAHVGRNDSPRGQGFVMGGVMKFPDAATLEAYNGHPAHQALLKWLVPLIEAIEVDFTSEAPVKR